MKSSDFALEIFKWQFLLERELVLSLQDGIESFVSVNYSSDFARFLSRNLLITDSLESKSDCDEMHDNEAKCGVELLSVVGDFVFSMSKTMILFVVSSSPAFSPCF